MRGTAINYEYESSVVSPEFGRWFLPKMSLYVYHRVQITPLVTGPKLFNVKVTFSQIDRSCLQVRSKRNQIDLDAFFLILEGTQKWIVI